MLTSLYHGVRFQYYSQFVPLYLRIRNSGLNKILGTRVARFLRRGRMPSPGVTAAGVDEKLASSQRARGSADVSLHVMGRIFAAARYLNDPHQV